MLERVWRKGNSTVLFLRVQIDTAIVENIMEVP